MSLTTAAIVITVLAASIMAGSIVYGRLADWLEGRAERKEEE